MKKILSLVVISLLVVSFSGYAQAPNYMESSIEKAKQGITNSLTGWLEVPFQTYKGYKEGMRDDGRLKILGGLFGIARGMFHAAGRTATGIMQLGTFLLPNPKDNHGVGIPLDAQYVWEKGEQYSIGQDGTSPIGKKAVRGLYNVGLGLLDGPGQLIKGVKQDKPWVGVANAVIFPVSRIVSGAFDITTAFLPNPTEGYGYPLEEKYPWDALLEGSYNNEL